MKYSYSKDFNCSFESAKNLLEITENKKIDSLSEKVDRLLESAFKIIT